ncbi:MAG: hypothetical protein WBZ36_00800 [Candidatus Nitrosopolaris sp.]
MLMQTHLEFRIALVGSMLVVLTLSTVTTIETVHIQSVSATTATPANQTGIHATAEVSNMTFVGNMTRGKSMMMPGGNMTFGASLQNAKMHLLEAMMDLKIGNTKGAMTELNLTDQSIKMHEQEIKRMMMEVKSMMVQMKGNTKS